MNRGVNRCLCYTCKANQSFVRLFVFTIVFFLSFKRVLIAFLTLLNRDQYLL